MNSTTQMIYPGMCDDSLEIFFHKEENRLMAIHNSQIKCFTKLPTEAIGFIYNIMDSEVETQELLQKWFPDDTEKQIQKLAKCRFGGLNFEPDYCSKKKSPNFDVVDCPLKGHCKGEGILCKEISYKGESLSNLELEALRLISSIEKNTAIAELLGMPLGTFNVFRTNLYEKLNIRTKQEATRVAVFLGLI
ncbi:helix-turn-helix transcriptional regulator [Riemerella anatipestifer]|uniref:Helix-turn-helix transcriptional regulator n=1 Tax=Riemerella anatipestifer TaxID=34085 RepID=A0AAP3AK58_RIEAN|nr:helix-turn-helix transcriptional regulator [Riemerella anatipestifer]MCE3025300.1 helix-turn-helix transcriptional regulator [Riemerella anatipestifer]MCU7560904.1 helix-turn-helix transcriptional regulator [Riemerella anatipestifer]MCU7567812.1 helix-turn-helix transcriptional regulator [Riemerella anatipestifer]MCW0489304.1 helix-turn-helix transcriptional regulator [Riemerella anatipestifer]MCW0523132.1 helix-turn-helix transcriptional regulator [Riemerella anatipestifer]